MTKKEKVWEILKRLYKIWPEPATALRYETPWQLLVAVILSAQTTDKQVNKITPVLFKKLNKVELFANASVEEINTLIKSLNYHNSKAMHLKASAKMIIEKYNGQVPDTMDALITLPGVARKTANVVLGIAFGKAEGIAVDTHVIRLSRQLGLTREHDPKKIEKDLMKIIPRENWIDWTHLLINYGREYCPAGKDCGDCPILGDLCKKGHL